MFKFSLLIIVIVSIILLPAVFSGETPLDGGQSTLPANNQSSLVEERDDALPAAGVLPTPEGLTVIEDNYSASQTSAAGEEMEWFIVSPDQPWEAGELAHVNDILGVVIESLDGEGLDGRSLLYGYRFRRQYGEYVTGHEGRIAVVNHASQEITLADAAFKRLHGFYIFHELGHVVDVRTGRRLSAGFHEQAGSDFEHGMTAPRYWLNLAAESDLEEATADAFALWMMAGYDAGYKPVFAHTPQTADYTGIENSLADSLTVLSSKLGLDGDGTAALNQ